VTNSYGVKGLLNSGRQDSNIVSLARSFCKHLPVKAEKLETCLKLIISASPKTRNRKAS
jgi:hypothetical protein